MQIQNFVTFDYISTFIGTISITMLLVQFLKELPGIKKIPTKYFTFIVAFMTILISNLHGGTIDVSNLYLMVINAVLITLTATGGYDFAFKKVTVKDETDTQPVGNLVQQVVQSQEPVQEVKEGEN